MICYLFYSWYRFLFIPLPEFCHFCLNELLLLSSLLLSNLNPECDGIMRDVALLKEMKAKSKSEEGEIDKDRKGKKKEVSCTVDYGTLSEPIIDLLINQKEYWRMIGLKYCMCDLIDDEAVKLASPYDFYFLSAMLFFFSMHDQYLDAIMIYRLLLSSFLISCFSSPVIHS